MITSQETRSILSIRSDSFAKAREFFAERGVMEVDCPSLISHSALDPNIELFQVEDIGFLHSSPEYAMKRLLSKYQEDIYQLAHVFRKDEKGSKHLPEFTMAEWYRIGFSLEDMMQETAKFLFLFLPKREIELLTYKEAFMKFTKINPFKTNREELLTFLQEKDISHHCNELDDLLDLILAYFIEPHLGKNTLTFLTHYPASQAALANTIHTSDGELSLRFEIYIDGVELANGYNENREEKEVRKRMERENRKRVELGKSPLPLDETFLASLATLPPCCGVSVGFDRMLMVALGKKTIKEVIPLFNTTTGQQEKSVL